jgi:hypothetical protein
MSTYLCRDVLFSPKKLGLQDADFNRNLGLSLLWKRHPRLAASREVPGRDWRREEMPWSFGSGLS